MIANRTWILPAGLLLAAGLLGCGGNQEPSSKQQEPLVASPKPVVNESEAVLEKAESVRDLPDPAVDKPASVVKDGIPALIRALEDEDSDFVRSVAVKALGNIGPDAIPALTKALEDEDSGVRWGAAEALGKMGPEAKAAIPALIKALEDSSSAGIRSVAAVAAETLVRIGLDAVPALTMALEDEERPVRYLAAEALGRIGSEPHIKPGVTVTITQDGAEFRVGKTTIACLSKGTTFPVTEVRGPWIGGYVHITGSKRAGWVLGKYLVVCPGRHY